MLADQFFPSPEELNSKPHLEKYLEGLKALQEKFLEEHPEEHPERVRLLGCGVLGEPFIPLVKKVFIPPKKNRKINIWNAHLRSSYAKGLKLKDPVDRQAITQHFADIKSGQAPGLSELEENARAFNSTIRAQNDTSNHLKYHISKLRQYSQHLKEEYNCHLVMIHSTCRDGHPDDYGCYANSAVGKLLEEQIYSGLGNRMVEVVFTKLLTNSSQDLKLAARGDDVAAPASIALKKLQVDSFESLDVSDGCKQKSMKREVLKEYITKEVLSLLRRHHNKDINQVNWMTLVDPTRSYRLDPWPRVEGDEVGGRYRLQMIGLCNLKELAIKLS
ncbi:hypothetical protein A0J61_11303 [Choanephora cucurbitarum]|uniref:Uncharacterized protein n=1 Tax=Choanephora cucurbitarum TaxID=101091 RepID=A0A1C7MV55_9FUNG|nr:hypothetical protein A0J61_11303 [Choanephora cucurbitarum]